MLKVDTIYMLEINKKNTCKEYRSGGESEGVTKQ